MGIWFFTCDKTDFERINHPQRTELHDLHGVQEPNLPKCKISLLFIICRNVHSCTHCRLSLLHFVFRELSMNIIYQYRDYFWNDSDCNSDVAHYICVKVLVPPENTFKHFFKTHSDSNSIISSTIFLSGLRRLPRPGNDSCCLILKK